VAGSAEGWIEMDLRISKCFDADIHSRVRRKAGGDCKATQVGKVFHNLYQATQLIASYKSSLSSSSVPKSMSALPLSESTSKARRIALVHSPT
jgi:hypothetical protein